MKFDFLVNVLPVAWNALLNHVANYLNGLNGPYVANHVMVRKQDSEIPMVQIVHTEKKRKHVNVVKTVHACSMVSNIM
jgi:hypothetical protein